MTTPLFYQGIDGRAAEIANLFYSVFSGSESDSEGALVAALVRNLIATTPADDLYCFRAEQDQTTTGAIFFSRLRYAKDPRTVFLLSPVAVATSFQRAGIGQALIRHGLEHLRNDGVDIVVTYGDPAYYGRVGFEPATTASIPAPQPLSQPHGWLAIGLSETKIRPLKSPVSAVPAFETPELW